MPQKFANNISLETFGAITASSTTVGFFGSTPTLPDISGADDFLLLTFSDGTNTEIVKVATNPTAGAFNIVRGQEGTTARDWPSGTTAEVRVTAAPLSSLTETEETFNERYIKYPTQFQNVLNEYIGSTTKETIFPGGGVSSSSAVSNENTHRILYGEPTTTSNRVGTRVLVDLIIQGSGSSTSSSSRSSASLTLELQLYKPASYSRPYVGEATRFTTYEYTSAIRVYYISGDVRYALFPALYVTNTDSFATGGMPFEFVNSSWYVASEDRTYFTCSTYGGSSLGSGSGISIYADIFKGVSNNGYKTYTRYQDNNRLMGQYTTYHNNNFIFSLGNYNSELYYKVRVGKRSSSGYNAPFTINSNSPGIRIERDYYEE